MTLRRYPFAKLHRTWVMGMRLLPMLALLTLSATALAQGPSMPWLLTDLQWRQAKILRGIATQPDIFSSSAVLPPSDDKLISIFQAYRSELDRLRQIALKDMHESSSNEANISNRLPVSRSKEYKDLLQLSPSFQVGANYDGSVRFIFASVGQAISPGWAKGIEFIPNTGKMNGTQMDTLGHSMKLPGGVYLRKLGPRWFLFFQRDV